MASARRGVWHHKCCLHRHSSFFSLLSMSTSLRIFLGGCLLVLLLGGGLVLLRPDLLMSLGLPSSEMRADAPRNGARAVRGQNVATQGGASQDGQAAAAQDEKAASGGHTTSPQQAPAQESDASQARPAMVVTVAPPKL